MRLILYTGKGGTGKSVIACATAIKVADLGYRSLIVSSDPAHTLSDIFETMVREEPVKVGERLWAMQVDPVFEVRRYYSDIQEYFASVLSARGLEETIAYEIASLPTMTQLMALLRVEEYASREDYDVIVVDTVPSGEALRYLHFPRLIGSLSKRFIELFAPFSGAAKLLSPLLGIPTPDKEFFKSQVNLMDRFEKLSALLRDPDKSSLRLIANPDDFSVLAMKRALMTASLYGLNVDLAIVNKVIPEDISEIYFLHWLEVQRRNLRDAEINFHPIPVKKLRLFKMELKSFEMLIKAGNELFQDEDPAKVYYRGSPFRIEATKDSLLYVIRVPFTEKENFEVERVGEELLVKVKSDVGKLVNIIPLPAIAYSMKLKKARLYREELWIWFERSNEQKEER